MSIRLLIVERNPFIRAGVGTLLDGAPGIDVCGSCATASEALRRYQAAAPDVVLLDQQLARQMPIQEVRAACDGSSGGGILIFLDHLQEEEVYNLISLGVSGFVAKRESPEILVAAIHAIAEGAEAWLSPRVSSLLLLRKATSAEEALLSERERHVLRNMALGHSSTEIAESCLLSPGTMRNLISGIYRKLGVNSRAGAVAWAWRSGLMHDSVG